MFQIKYNPTEDRNFSLLNISINK